MRKQTGSRNRGWLPTIGNRLSVAAGVALAAGMMAAFAPRAEATVAATGGTMTFASENGTNYFVHTFTTVGSNSFNVSGDGNVELLVVGGGGGGGSRNAGGGGAGGLIYTSSYPVVAGSSYTVTVGGGGGGGGPASGHYNGGPGGDSVFGSLTAKGGGYGNATCDPYKGGGGGSGGGGSPGCAGGVATNSGAQGNNGGSAVNAVDPNYSGGGGGGAGGAGSNCTVASKAGDGGPGVSNNITGAWVMYAAGGGGGAYQNPSTVGKGGSGIGGDGGKTDPAVAAGVGAVNTGSGGGGGGVGGNGGSGIVIVRYPIPDQKPTPCQMQITFGGYTNRSEVLTNFPVLVVFSNNINNYVYFASTNGYDLRFGTNSTPTTNSLNYEIESWNLAGASYVWVQVPTIPGDGSGAIWANWGNTSASNQLACTTNGAVWTNGYIAVYHFAQSSAPVLDSTSNQLNGTITGSPLWTKGSGVGAGAAWNFTQTDKQRINVPDTVPRLCPANITVEAWAKQTSLTTGADGFDMMVSKGYDGKVPWHLADGMSGGAGQFGFGAYDAGWKSAMDVDNPTTRNIIHYWSGTFNGSAFTLYKNGAYASSTNYPGSLPSGTRQFTIADSDWGGDIGRYRFTGLIDEVRISSFARSSNWVYACYLNMASNTVFNNYGVIDVKRLKGTVFMMR